MKNALLSLLITVGLATQAQASPLWFHLTVREDGARGDQVTMNLPLRLVQRVGPILANHYHEHDVMIACNDWRVRGDDLHAVWRAVKASSGKPVNVSVDDGEVQAELREGSLVMRRKSTWDSEVTEVLLPADLAEALVSGFDDELNVRAAIDRMIARGQGELMLVRSDDAVVRMWIDTQMHAPRPGTRTATARGKS